MRPAVSIIIPCYNEELRIPKAIQILNAWIDAHPFDEVLFSNDGSKDNTIEQIMNLKKHHQMKIMESGFNFGKWNAIRKAFFMCTKSYVVLLDADLSVHPRFIDVYGDMMNGDVLLGDRYGQKGILQVPFSRLITSKVFNLCVRFVVGLKVRDCQCPFKAFPRNEKMASLFGLIEEKRFSGDVEFIKRAKLMGFQMKFVEVDYDFKEGSTVSIRKHAWPMFKALWVIRRIR